MHKIKRVSKAFRILFQIAFIMLPLLTIIDWVSLQPFPSYMHIEIKLMSSYERLYGCLISLLPILIDMIILNYLIKLFRNYENGEVFNLNIISYIRNIGIGMLLSVIVNIIYLILINLLLLHTSGLEHRFDFITFSYTDIIVGFLVILNSWIMAEGYKIHEEQKLTV